MVDAPTLEAGLDGENVKVSPPVVIVVALDKPVGSVTTTPLSEMTVCPAEWTDVSALAPGGTKVRVSPSVVIVVALDRPVGSVTMTPLSEKTVSPAVSVLVTAPVTEGTNVRVSPPVTIVVAEERLVGRVTKMPLTLPQMIVRPKLLVENAEELADAEVDS